MAKQATADERNYLFSLFRHESKPYRKIAYSSYLLMTIAMFCNDVFNPLIVSKILGDIANKEGIDSLQPYVPVIILLIILEIVSVLFRRCASYLEERFDAHCRRAIVTYIFGKLLEHPIYFHQNRFVGKTITLISKTADSFGRTSGLILFNFIPLVVAIVGTGILLLPRVPIYFFLLVVLSVIYIGIVRKLLPKQLELSAQSSEITSKIFGAMSDAVSNITAVKAESSEELEQERISQIGDDWLLVNKKFARHVLIRDGLISNSVIRSLRVLCVVFALLAAIGHVENVQTIYLAATMTFVYMGHLWNFADSQFDVTVFYGEAAPIIPMLSAEPDIKDESSATDIGKVEGTIRFTDVEFLYPNKQEPVFQSLNFTVSPGEKIGIVGRSGAGKSTLVKLILRFLDINQGVISIDEKDIRSITQESLRKNIAYVSQEPILFHRTVYDNITYGIDGVTQEAIDAVLKRSHSDEFISQLPKGINSIVGERGVNLSGGQRQRISIARAMLKNCPILILDEATSALDSESEGYVQSAFAELMKERTTIVIAHRLSTLLNMDRILVFDYGEIVEQGTHDSLVDGNGIYSALWKHQAGGFLSSN